MTVRELVARLQQLNQDATIVVYDADCRAIDGGPLSHYVEVDYVTLPDYDRESAVLIST
jgi:hypothetical protein